MSRSRLTSSIFLSIFLLIAFNVQSEEPIENLKMQVAFMADVHLQDVYGEFEDSDYKGVENSENGKFVMARTMQAQLSSTRIFNENYFAFLAALDDVVERGIKYVVLPGDFSDDGQPVNVRGLRTILNDYTDKYGIHFLATTGNHDPVRPFAMEAGKKDFVGAGGKPQVIMSTTGMYNAKSSEHPVVVTQDIRKLGYEGLITSMSDFGFYPKSDDVYWETPFTTYSYDDYSYATAEAKAGIQFRNYLIPPYNTSMPDVSYLVEPEEGLWFLSIDANVYIPTSNAQYNSTEPSYYKGSSYGYNDVLTHKKHLIEWVSSVCARAEEKGKTLIVFSHYPMIEFNNDATDYIESFLGDGKMQTSRVPDENVATAFADAGVKLHFCGHMHINDTGIRKTAKGNTLVNIQVPSLAAYVPAYKLLTVESEDVMEVETIVIDSVPRFNELFPVYEMEYDYLTSINASNIWDKEVLTSSTYHEFTSWHLRELLRLRFLDSDWPSDFKGFFLASTGRELLAYSKAELDSFEEDLAAYDTWTGFDMIYDLYCLRSADELALRDIGQERIVQYNTINDAFLTHLKVGQDDFAKDLQDFASIFQLFLNGTPADHFSVDLKKGEVTELEYIEGSTSLTKVKAPSFTLYPNPARVDGTVNIKSNCYNRAISIFDLEGHLVKSEIANSSGASTLDLAGMKSGIYLISVASVTQKLIVLD